MATGTEATEHAEKIGQGLEMIVHLLLTASRDLKICLLDDSLY